MPCPRREPPSASCASSPGQALVPLQQRELAELVGTDWQQTIPQHHYSLGEIAGALILLLDCRGSLRGSALALGLFSRLLGFGPDVPSPTTVRTWLLRIGLYQLQRPLEHAEDWVWIVDHTVQIGELKCMLVVGLRLSGWQEQPDRRLSYEDVDLIGLWPVRSSTGEVVDEQLESAIARTGLPRLVISDDGRDLHRGLALFQERHAEAAQAPDWIYDIKHKTASLLKRELEHNPVWTAFAQGANQMKRQVQQTELAFLNPPQQRGKARYMSVDSLVVWGVKALGWLDNPRPTGRDLDEERIEAKLAWLRDYREPLRCWQQAMSVIGTVETLVRQEGYHAASAAELAERLPTVEPDSLAERLSEQLTAFVGQQAVLARAGERLPGSSEVLESIIGKYKRLQGEGGQFGVTGMVLSVGAFVGRLTLAGIHTALTSISGLALRAWEETHLEATIQSQRKQAFPSPPRGTKTGTNQLILTATN